MDGEVNGEEDRGGRQGGERAGGRRSGQSFGLFTTICIGKSFGACNLMRVPEVLL